MNFRYIAQHRTFESSFQRAIKNSFDLGLRLHCEIAVDYIEKNIHEVSRRLHEVFLTIWSRKFLFLRDSFVCLRG